MRTKLDAARAEKLIAFAEEARSLTRVPGVALAVVQDGKVVLEKGLGVRELGKNEPVTPETLFMIGSMTKPLTSLMMARLVDRKNLHLGHAGHDADAVVRARRSRRDPQSDDGAHGVRLHRPAALGHGVHLRVGQVDARFANRAVARHEADDRASAKPSSTAT